jgi:hypothetical protein
VFWQIFAHRFFEKSKGLLSLSIPHSPILGLSPFADLAGGQDAFEALCG